MFLLFPKIGGYFQVPTDTLTKTNMAMEKYIFQMVDIPIIMVVFGGVRETSRFCEATKKPDVSDLRFEFGFPDCQLASSIPWRVVVVVVVGSR